MQYIVAIMQYDIILNSISDGVFTVDLDFNITLFNSAAEELTGFPKKHALKKKCFEIFRTSICESDCIIKKTLKTGKPITNKRVTVINSDGIEIPISVSTGILKSKTGKIIGAVETFRDCSDIELLKTEIDKSYELHNILGKSKIMQDLFKIMPDIAANSSTVLIEGPSGSGKELFARAIHKMSARNKKPFVAINCGAIPYNLMESELFGHVKGSFTDAKETKLGKFEIAKGGTIFFDEISELHPHLQVKLLRVLQEKEFEQVGGTKTYKTDVKIIFATNKPLRDLVEKNLFREDLYFRINVLKLTLPSLKDRKEDIPLLVGRFIQKFNLQFGKSIKGLAEEAAKLLIEKDYLGNIRELENVIEHAFVLCHNDIIDIKHFPNEFTKINLNNDILDLSHPKDIINNTEKEIILKALEKYKYNKNLTAKNLDMHPATLWRKMKKLGL